MVYFTVKLIKEHDMWTQRVITFGAERRRLIVLNVFNVMSEFIKLDLLFQLRAIVASELLNATMYLVNLVFFCLLILLRFLCLHMKVIDVLCH
jgi:hypothetical protein